MTRKTVKQAVEKLKINEHYDLRYNQIIELGNIDDKYDIIALAFDYGYLQGSKATKKQLRGIKA